MTPECPQQTDQLFQLPVKRESDYRISSPGQSYSSDESFRREVQLLLARYGRHKGSPERIAVDLLEKGYSELVGRTVGAYKILRLLGCGGMGEVYLAQDLRLGRQVALKLLPLQFTNDAGRLRRFEQEARNAAALNYPNIMTIHEIGQDAGWRFIVTEYIEGKTLRHQMIEKRMTLKGALDVAIQVASALAAAHAAGIIHRDVKPENIMIRPDGIVKVLDFGLAKLMDHEPVVNDAALTVPACNTDSGTVKGTTTYMSPEQARGLEIDERTDIWSLGVVLYEAIAGRAPFEGPTKSDVLVSILTSRPPLLQEHSREVPAKLDWIVAKSLRKDRDKRYQTVKDLLVDLRAMAEELERDAKINHSTPEKTDPSEWVWLSDGRAATVSTRDEGGLISSFKYLIGATKQQKSLMVALALIVGLGVGFFSHEFTVASNVHFSAHPGEIANNNANHVKLVDVATPLPLVTGPTIQSSPTLSSDGRYIAFLHQSANGSGFCIVPPLIGADADQADPDTYLKAAVEGRSIVWSPDGKILAVMNKSSSQDPLSIFLLSLDSVEQSMMNTPRAISARRW